MLNETRSREEARTQRRPSSSPRRNSSETGARQEKAFQERKSSQHASSFRRVVVRKGMLVVTCIHLSVLFIKKETAKLGLSVLLSTRKLFGSAPKKRKHSVVVAKTLDYTPAEEKLTVLKFIAKPYARDVSHPSDINFTENWREYCQEVPTVLRHRTICERAREEMSNLGCFYNKVDKVVEVRMLCRTSNSEVEQI